MSKIYASRRFRIVTVATTVFAVLLVMASLHFASAVASSSTEHNGTAFSSAASSKVFASDGHVIATLHGEVNRDPVKLAEIPLSLQRAVIAIEDRRFYEHRGLDARGLIRAAFAD